MSVQHQNVQHQSVVGAVAESATEPEGSKPIGVQLVVDPPDAAIDIVAVHGLGGDAFRTWTARNGTFWLKDLLPKEVPSARVLSFGYNSDPARWQEPASVNMIHHHAQTLVAELVSFRRRTESYHRPIVFVVHSLGGLVVKRALIYSHEASATQSPKERSIKLSTWSVIFLGTPHAGSSLAYWGGWLESVVRMVSFKSVDTNKYLIEALHENSETLQNITSQFANIAEEFKLFFFWEELKTRIGPSKWEIIVPYSSAVPESLPNAGKAAIHADHSTMCKFTGPNAPGWNILAGLLRDAAEESAEGIKLNWQAEAEQRRLDHHKRTLRHAQGVLRERRSPSPHMNDVPWDMSGSTLQLGHEPGLLTGSVETIRPHEVYEPHETAALIRHPSFPNMPLYKPATLQENRFSVVRASELAAIHTVLQKKRTLAIVGATGRGKTHLARQYFFDHLRDYPGGAFWLQCKQHLPSATEDGDTDIRFSTDLLDMQFTEMAEELKIPIDDRLPYGADPDEVIRKVIEHLERTDNWLLVFDGVDIADEQQQDAIYQYLPKVANRGSILLTTVNRSLAGASRVGSPDKLEMEKMDEEAGLKMLFHYAQIDNPTELDRKSGVELLQQLDFTPLMVHSAGSYIKTKRVTVTDYLKKYKHRPFVDSRILDLAPFHAIFLRIQEDHKEAHNFLRIMAFYEQELQLELLLWGMKSLDDGVRLSFMAQQGGRRDFNNTIAPLLAYALVERSPKVEEVEHSGERYPVDTIRLHTVARDVCLARMRKESRSNLRHWLQVAIIVFCKSFETLNERREEGEFLLSDYWKYVVHGRSLQAYAKRYHVSTTDVGGSNLDAAVERANELARGSVDTHAGPRRSMFRSGSMTDTSSLDSPCSERSRTHSFNILPVELRTHSPDRADEEERKKRQEATKMFEENLRRINSEKNIKFRYEPKGRRGSTVTIGRGRPLSRATVLLEPSTAVGTPTSHVFLEDVFSHNGSVSVHGPARVNSSSSIDSATSVAKSALEGFIARQKTLAQSPPEDPVPTVQEPPRRMPSFPNWMPAPPYNPVSPSQTPVGEASTLGPRPIMQRLRSGSLPTQHANSAPVDIGIRALYNTSSPSLVNPPEEIPLPGSPVQAVGRPHAPFMSPTINPPGYVPMPPYPVTPTTESANPIEVARGHHAQYYPVRNASDNLLHRPVLTAREQLSSSVSSEPIYDDSSDYSSTVLGSTPIRRDLSILRRSPAVNPRPGTRSPSPYALFSLDGAVRRNSTSRPGSASGARRYAHARAAQDLPFRPPASPSLKAASPPNVGSPGLGIGNVVFPFELPADRPPGPVHTRHASLGDTPRAGLTRLGIPNARSPLNPARRGSASTSTAPQIGGEAMGRSQSEPGKTHQAKTVKTGVQGVQGVERPVMPGCWSPIEEVSKSSFDEEMARAVEGVRKKTRGASVDTLD